MKIRAMPREGVLRNIDEDCPGFLGMRLVPWEGVTLTINGHTQPPSLDGFREEHPDGGVLIDRRDTPPDENVVNVEVEDVCEALDDPFSGRVLYTMIATGVADVMGEILGAGDFRAAHATIELVETIDRLIRERWTEAELIAAKPTEPLPE